MTSTLPAEIYTKYYFVPSVNRSYLLSDIIRCSLVEHEKFAEANKAAVLPDYRLSKETFLDKSTCLSSEDAFIQWVKRNFILDKTMNADMEGENKKDGAATSWVCSLTHDKLEQPCLLNLTGRTYSFPAIRRAIEETLLKDENLRLEDATITPDQVKDIVLYKHKTMIEKIGEKNVHIFPNKISYERSVIQEKPFDTMRVYMRNIPEMSDVIDNYGRDAKDKQEIWNSEDIISQYLKLRRLPPVPSQTTTIEDLFLRNIKLFRHHPKCNDGGNIIFKNVLIKGCKLEIRCWCGVVFRQCHFVNCTVDLRNTDKTTHRLNLSNVYFINCEFILKKDNFEADSDYFPKIGIIRNLLDVLMNIVKDEKYLRDCSLRLL